MALPQLYREKIGFYKEEEKPLKLVKERLLFKVVRDRIMNNLRKMNITFEEYKEGGIIIHNKYMV